MIKKGTIIEYEVKREDGVVSVIAVVVCDVTSNSGIVEEYLITKQGSEFISVSSADEYDLIVLPECSTINRIGSCNTSLSREEILAGLEAGMSVANEKEKVYYRKAIEKVL